jgi:hypothetical protein
MTQYKQLKKGSFLRLIIFTIVKITSTNKEIKQILLDGFPAQSTFKELSSNKLELTARGNSKTFVDNPQLVRKTMNKDDHHSHLVPMDQLLCKFFTIPLSHYPEYHHIRRK